MSEVPYEVILMTGMDQLTSGGTLKVVIRTQEQFDSLYAVRFTDRLKMYWERDSADIAYWARINYPGLTDSAYAVLSRKLFFEDPPFQGLDTCTKPVIDFSRYALLGQDANDGGCTQPTYSIAVTSDPIRLEIRFTLTVTIHGACEPYWTKNVWILVPRIPPLYKVVLERKNIQQ